jgi:hypothetical protein
MNLVGQLSDTHGYTERSSSSARGTLCEGLRPMHRVGCMMLLGTLRGGTVFTLNASCTLQA